MKNAVGLILVLFFSDFLNAQVGIGTTTPDASSILDVSSETHGMLLPRLTTVQRNAIVNPANGLILFNTSTANFNYFDTVWKDFSPGYKSVNAIGTISTTSTDEINIPGMSLVPAEGIHSVTFESQISNTSFNSPSLVDSNLLLTDYYLLYDQLVNYTTTNALHAGNFGNGETLTSGKYSIGSAISVTGALILDGSGDSNSVFIIHSTGAINFAASCTIILTNGASAENVFWLAEGAIGIGASCIIKGTLMSHDGAIAVGASCTIDGRMITNAGAVSFGPGVCTSPATTSTMINVRSLHTFVIFTGSGAISNTASSTYNGNICSGLGDTSSLSTATVNGIIVPPNSYTQISNGINTIATFSIYQNDVLIPSSSKQITCNSDYTNLSLSAIVTVSEGQLITVKWKVNSGNLSLGNRVLTCVKVQ
jgi:hypothetical protein